ncbi:MAG TPA: M1 family aminopeptidase [Terriglobales bacterium]|nr:M1 family aminopeptidase [Terriglobales bacterium]
MKRALAVTVCVLVCCLALVAQDKTANADPTYQQLRQIKIGDTVSVDSLTLKRDAGTFAFHQGVFTLLAPVNGKITGAIYDGDGTFSLEPPLPEERRSLSLLSKSSEFVEHFQTVVLRFSDGTADEIKAASKPGGTPVASAAAALKESQDAGRYHLNYNLDARLLADVLSGNSGLFVAFIHGKNYDSKMVYTVDPEGAPFVAPEEVSLRTYDEAKEGIWAAFHLQKEYASSTRPAPEANPIDIETQKLDTSIEKSGNLRGDAATTFKAARFPVRVAPFDLFPSLRVSKVTTADGQPLEFIQEDKKEDANFWVILPKTVAPGEEFTVHTIYEGKDAVTPWGGGNYYPVARENWYPATTFGDYASYDMTFHVPKKLKLVASADLVSDKVEGDQNVSVWRSSVPEAVAGFNMGDFKVNEAKGAAGMTVEAYANKEEPDFITSLKNRNSGAQQLIGAGPDATGIRTAASDYVGPQQMMLGDMNTTELMQKPLAEADLATKLYTAYFGPISYKRVSMTQQTACNFGQSWPELVYLPICSFFDETVRHQLKLDDTRGYWQIVAPHEVAHQWWGHTVGWPSYRDQWMSEGFSDFSASLFLQMVEKNPQRFIKFWNDERDLLTEGNAQGFRAIDVGPVTLGYRLASTRTGFDIPRRLIYPKGAYILHMVRMMMWDNKTGDRQFEETMQDFVKTFADRPATTEDFKAVLEKHMTAEMDLDHNHKLDWFFNEYVYGTALPSYQVESSFAPGANGATVIKLQVKQSNVDPSFKMMVPVYLEYTDGKVFRLGMLKLIGDQTFSHDIAIKLPEAPKAVLLNYYDDVLAAK